MRKLTNGAHSPLRYPGGKGKLTRFVDSVLKKNRISGTYIEPFAGGAGIAINLLLAQKVEKIIINDLDSSVFSFWKAITTQPDQFIKLLSLVDFDYLDHAVKMTAQERYRFWVATKNNFKFYRNTQTLKEGFYFFLLNRMNVSGIITGGPIGGKSQDGMYNISSRLNKRTITRQIETIAEYSDKIQVKNLEATQLLTKYYNGEICENDDSLVFVDPPYYQQGKALYNSYMTNTLHSLVANSLTSNPKSNWILTYDISPQILSLYDQADIQKYRYSIAYSANKRGKYDEFMFVSPNLNVESFDNVLLKNEV